MKKLRLLLFVFCNLLFCTRINAQAPNIQWQKSYGGSDGEVAQDIQPTIDGGYVLAGYTSSNNGDVTGNHGDNDFWIVKIDSAGTLIWQKTFGGSGDDRANSIQPTPDGGYIIAGFTLSNDGDVSGLHGLTLFTDFWIIKTDSAGNLQWQKCLGGTADEEASSISLTTDGNYIVAGGTNSNNGDVSGNHGALDCWVVKLDTAGAIIWQQCLGGSDFDEAFSIQQTSDGGYIIAGNSNSNNGDVSGNHGGFDSWVVKLDSNGSISWQKSLGGTNEDGGNHINQTDEGGYIVAGLSASNDFDVSGNHGSRDYWIVKLDSTGSIIWQKSLGGSDFEHANSVLQTTDSDYVVTGYSISNNGNVSGNHGGADFWILKLDTVGNIKWQKCYGGTQGESPSNILQTSDSGYIVGGHSTSNDGDVSGNHGNSDIWVIKLSPDGITGINDAVNDAELSVYPNPFNEELAVGNLQLAKEKTIINLYDIYGRTVLSQPLTTAKSKLKTANLSSGIYIYEVRTKDTVFKKGKVVKE